jgi:DNA-binding beta-propeller fold protein YncE
VGSRLAVALVVSLFASISPNAALHVEILRSIAALPPHVVGAFEEPIDFQQARSGAYYVFDRRGHTVYIVDETRTVSRKAIEIGHEDGRVIQPIGFDLAPDGRFVVADVPRLQQRVQTFDASGKLLTGFFLPGTPAARVILGSVMLNGAGSVQFAGETLLVSHPESGWLFTEYTPGGSAFRSVGRLRTTGFEDDRDVHIAMNAGLPLVDPAGGYFYVFITGKPMFRKYDAEGTLIFERHIEGSEIDKILDSQPTRWPKRRVQDREVPLVTPVVRAAEVDPRGNLWISLVVPFTYVYDATGDKTRTVQFSAAGIISPSSLSFGRDGHLLVTPGCYEFDPR